MVRLATVLLIIGGLNWGLIGLFNFDLVAAIFGGPASVLSRIIYTLVGVAAVYEIFQLPRMRRLEERPTTTATVDRIDRAA